MGELEVPSSILPRKRRRKSLVKHRAAQLSFPFTSGGRPGWGELEVPSSILPASAIKRLARAPRTSPSVARGGEGREGGNRAFDAAAGAALTLLTYMHD